MRHRRRRSPVSCLATDSTQERHQSPLNCRFRDSSASRLEDPAERSMRTVCHARNVRSSCRSSSSTMMVMSAIATPIMVRTTPSSVSTMPQGSNSWTKRWHLRPTHAARTPTARAVSLVAASRGLIFMFSSPFSGRLLLPLVRVHCRGLLGLLVYRRDRIVQLLPVEPSVLAGVVRLLPVGDLGELGVLVQPVDIDAGGRLTGLGQQPNRRCKSRRARSRRHERPPTGTAGSTWSSPVSSLRSAVLAPDESRAGPSCC